MSFVKDCRIAVIVKVSVIASRKDSDGRSSMDGVFFTWHVACEDCAIPEDAVVGGLHTGHDDIVGGAPVVAANLNRSTSAFFLPSFNLLQRMEIGIHYSTVPAEAVAFAKSGFVVAAEF